MAENLLIVESPAKVKTISKFLGKDYHVEASYGHIIDLPKSRIGVNPDKDFEISYITIRGKGKILNALKRYVKNATNIYLATDPDREGETISWHLKNALKLDNAKNKKCYRISFNEITKNAVVKAIKNPREIDINLINSQQARRVIDRLVGYTISPILWEKIKRGLSAGRVQSVALKLICDREKEILAFIPVEYWTLSAILLNNRNDIEVSFYGKEKEKMSFSNEEEVIKVINDIGNSKFKVVDIKESKREKKSPLPFTTSTLQQEAGKLLNFSISKTMKFAQQLYEGVELKGRGTTSLITYIRTDSTRVSDEAKEKANEYIRNNYGTSYLLTEEKINNKNSQNKVQDAHEAIRPTYIDIEPDSVKDSLSRDEFRLYRLIWQRFIASRMSSAIYETKKIIFKANDYIFNANTSDLKFVGFLSVYRGEEDKEEKTALKFNVNLNDELKLKEFVKLQHFTEPPAHFTESLLVKYLEENGIGRPSTYAPIITTLLNRRYINKEKKNLFVTELGFAVNDMMEKGFKAIIDEHFTANMESNLDKVENGEKDWKEVLKEFYTPFIEDVKYASDALSKITIKEEESDEICDKCGSRMVIKYGPYGKFLACPNFPDCKNTKNYIERTGYICPKCKEGELTKQRTKKGKIFYACERLECDYMSWKIPKEAKKKDDVDDRK